MTTLFMRSTKLFSLVFLFLIILGTVSFPLFVGAQTTSTTSTSDLHLVFEPPCVKIGVGSIDSCSPITDIQTYIKRLYQFAVGISGIVAVGMIVYGAILIIVKSENVVAKSEGKQIIQDALWGVLLLFASYLLLNTINPELVKLKEPTTGDIIKTTTSSQLTQLNAVSCGTSTNIYAVNGVPIYSGDSSTNTKAPQGPDGEYIEPDNKCGFRRVILRHAADITDNSGEASKYYAEDEGLDENTIVWTYPYFIKSEGAKNASDDMNITTKRCVIYAIREPVDDDEKAETVMVDLNSNITPCILNDKQKPGWIWGNDVSSTTINTNTTIISSTTLSLVKAKAEFLKNTGKVLFDGNGDCPPNSETSANGVFSSLLSGQAPYICSSSCACSKTNTTVSVNLLSSLINLTGRTDGFTITSLTGGAHSANSAHYSGIAADLKPTRTTSWDQLFTQSKTLFDSNKLFCEVYYDTTAIENIKKLPISESNPNPKYLYSTDPSSGAITFTRQGKSTRCTKESKYHCMEQTDGCWDIFSEAGGTGKHIHVQTK
ncbi:MAG: Uncharacterized protein LiPW41_134 [Parcubacteria group bacterium LiPW_41]|nr:MAG: Uncharacterized protein LiPW41_134 [Parcubacteria group bacterium LiPW_41]